MNTLVEEGDGNPQAPRTGESDAPRAAASGRAPVPAGPGDRGPEDPARAAPTLFDRVAPTTATLADNATLIELAPQSGKTLMHEPGPRSRDKAPPPPAGAGARVAAGDTVATDAVEALGLLRHRRARIWAPILAAALGLAATAWPLWRRASQTDSDEPAPARSSALTPHAAPEVQAAPIEPAAGTAEEVPTAAIEQEAVVAPAGAAPPAAEPRQHTRAPSNPHHKPRGPVLRTRNGSPVVD